jgi:hypothetical protein
MHTVKTLAPLAGALVLAAAPGACSTDSGKKASPVQVAEIAQPLNAWVNARLEQVLRVNPGETLVRNRCELTVPLSAPKALAFIGSTGASTEELGWTGSAATGSKLSISGCDAYPCEVAALWRASAENGTAAGCSVIVDDGLSRFVGASSGTALTVAGPPSSPVIFNQDVKLGPSGTAGSCTFRQSAVLAEAEVTGLGVFVKGIPRLDLPGPIPIGNVPFPTELGPLAFGTIQLGAEASPAATRLKHMTRKGQLGEGDTVRCAGQYHASSGSPVYDVNVSAAPVGNGMSLTTDPTGWTCDAAKFGTDDGCDCECGVVDPDCAPDACAAETTLALRGTVVPGARRASGATLTLRGALSPHVVPRVSAGSTLQLKHAGLTPR